MSASPASSREATLIAALSPPTLHLSLYSSFDHFNFPSGERPSSLTSQPTSISQLWCCVVLRVVLVVGAPTVRVGETAGDARDEELVGE